MFTITSYHHQAGKGMGGKVLGEKWVEPMGRALRTATIEAIEDECDRIMVDAKARTPVDTGALKSTGRVRRDGATVTMSFGGRATNGKVVRYAVYVHEITWYKHKIGEAKFLENAINAARRGLEARIDESVQYRLGGLK